MNEGERDDMVRRFRQSRYMMGLVLHASLLVALVMPFATAHAPLAARAADEQRAVGMPMRIRIPAINVNTLVERVGKDETGAMALPKSYDNTAWYELGPRPGELGNSVIAGHVDSTTTIAIFWNLRKLVPGDEIVVTGEDNVERKFRVTALERYPYDEVPISRVFGNADGTHLNIITCDAQSAFNPGRLEYAGNIVVYTDMVP